MLRPFCPDRTAESITAVCLDDLWLAGIRGLILDVDNTIIPWGSDRAIPEVKDWIEASAAKGFHMCLLSNASTERVAKVSALYAIPYVPRALKPFKSGFRKALQVINMPNSEVAVIGDQLLTDVLGGNRCGIRTIWVKPLSCREFIGTRLVNRRLEKWCYTC